MTETDHTPRLWTDDDLTLMHQVGRDYEHGQLAILADDAQPLAPSPVPYETRVERRIAEMARAASREYKGGPVAWLPGWTPGAGDGP